jgi:hypothetical protein
VAKYKHSPSRKSDNYNKTITAATTIINKDEPKTRTKKKRNQALQLI